MKPGTTHIFHNGHEEFWIKVGPDGRYEHCPVNLGEGGPWIGGHGKVEHLEMYVLDYPGNRAYFSPVDGAPPDVNVKFVDPKPKVGWWGG